MADSKNQEGEPRRRGDDSRYVEFLGLFTAHQKQILGRIYHMLHNHHDAQDVFQRTSLVLWEKFDDFEMGTNFLAWASQVAFYQSRNFLRTAARDRHYFNDKILDLLQEEHEAAEEGLECRREALSDCLEKLRPNDRELVRQVYQEDESIRELAEQMGKAAQTLYNRLNGIRRRLYACIQLKIEQGEEA